MELGQTRDLTQPFAARRTIINNANSKDVERVMNKFRMASLKLNTVAPEQSSGIAFWRKNEPDADLLDDDALSFDDVINCPLCREEFKRFKKKTRCPICLRVVCQNCNSKTLPAKGVDGVEREMKMCDACYGTITKEHKRLQLKKFFEASAKSSFTTFYEGVYLLVTVIQRDLPKFRLLVNSPLTASKLKKAKELDASLTENLKDFEREIKSIEHFQVNTKKQQQLRDAIKIAFVTALSGTAPEFKVLHKQLEVAATQPLAPEESDTDSPLIAKVVQTSSSASTPSTTPSSTPNASPSQKKEKRRLTTRLSTFFSSSSLSLSSSHVRQPSVGKPSISGISPVLSPLSGETQITINGENFDADCRVEIGNEECIVIERNPETVIVLSPPKKESAPVDVCVINKNGERSVFSNVLFYAEDSMFKNESPSISDSYGSAYDTTQPTINEPYNNDTYNNTYNTPTDTSPKKTDQNGHRTFGTQQNSPPKDEYRNSSYRTFGQPGTAGNINRSPSSSELNGSSGSVRTFGNPLANASPTKPIQTGGSSRSFANLSPFESGSASSSGSSGSYRGFGNTGSTPSTLDLNGGSYKAGNSYSPPSKSSPPKNAPNGVNSSFKSLNLNSAVRNNYGEEDEGGELSVTMINPVVSPLQGTRITMELNKPLPPDTKIKVGGKPAAARVSETNPRMISFVSPALPAGITNIEIITGAGKSTMMEGILMYEVLSPQYSSNYARSDTVKSSGRVWGKKN